MVLPASASSPGSEDSVMIGGSQSPSTSYTYDGWDQPSWYGCSNPEGSSSNYVRWYVNSVTATQVYIDRIYFSVRPNRTGFFSVVRLDDPNGNVVKTAWVGKTLYANQTTSYTLSVKKWVPISTTRPIVHTAVVSLDPIGAEGAACHGERYPFHFLKRQ
jgi:hypothetical protein